MGTCSSKKHQNGEKVLSSSQSSLKEVNQQFVVDFVPENTEKISKNYKVLSDVLGRGSYGEVRKALYFPTNEYRAVKIIYKQECSAADQQNIFKEVLILKELDHPNIVKIYEYFSDEKFIFIVMELVQGGELFDRIVETHHFSEKKAAEILHQLLSAVNYLHSHKIVHRDLKPENILLDGNVLKLVDFGTSRHFDSAKKMKETHGTPYYIAPEVLAHSYNENCDVWSCGVILYILLSGSPPFDGNSDEEILAAVERGQFSFELPEFGEISDYAKKLISKMLTYNPKQRISVSEALNDVWFKIMLAKTEVRLSPVALANLKNFNVKNKMQEAILFFIVNQMATREEKNELLSTFKALDTNQDGVLSKEELIAGLKQVNQFISEHEVEVLMDRLDHNKNKAINYTEFVAAAIDKKKLLSDDRINACFKIFDKDKSGKISLGEIKEVFGAKNIVDEKVWVDAFKQLDQNGNGELDLNEFKELLLKFIE